MKADSIQRRNLTTQQKKEKILELGAAAKAF